MLEVAVHFDIDTIDSKEIVLGLGAVPGGLTSEHVRRLVGDVAAAADVVAAADVIRARSPSSSLGR